MGKKMNLVHRANTSRTGIPSPKPKYDSVPNVMNVKVRNRHGHKNIKEKIHLIGSMMVNYEIPAKQISETQARKKK